MIKYEEASKGMEEQREGGDGEMRSEEEESTSDTGRGGGDEESGDGRRQWSKAFREKWSEMGGTGEEEKMLAAGWEGIKWSL